MAELVLGVIGAAAAIDVVIKYGGMLVKTCQNFKAADNEISERILRIESKWHRTKSQAEVLNHVWSELTVEHQQLQLRLLAVLQLKLSTAETQIRCYLNEDFSPPGQDYGVKRLHLRTRKKARYAVLKTVLERTIHEMDDWQNEFDPSWFLIARIGSRTIYKAFNNFQQADNSIKTATDLIGILKAAPEKPISVHLPNQALEGAKYAAIAFSSVRLAQREGSSQWLVLDSIRCDDPPDYQRRLSVVRDLARKLTKTDPLTFSLLKCSGFLADKADLHLQLALKTPGGMSNPQSLRSSLLAARSNHNLSERFQIALQLARAVCSVHTFGLVHKSIYPENILLFKGKDERSVLGSAFLVGFGNIRLESGQTNRRGDADWHKNIYRHPERQGLDLAKPYIMQHDIYSLGVCLLEIGLWQSFIQYDGDSPNYERSQSHSLYADDQGPHSSYRVKESLRALAGDPLRRHMGSNYARVVENCLTCLDEDNEDFGDESEFQDEEGVLIAIKYIETILGQLSRISV